MNKQIVLAVFLGVGLVRAEPEASEGYKSEIQITPLLRTMNTSARQPIVYPATNQAEVTAVLVEIPPGAETGWHKHLFPCFAYIESGTLEVDLEGGKTHRFTAGQALAESIHLLHNGRNTGIEPVRLVMFVMGEKGKPFTERAAEPPASNAAAP